MIDWEPIHSVCMSVFGEPAVYTAPGGHAPQQITGVFDEAYLQLFPMGGALGQEQRQLGSSGNVTAAQPILGVQLSQFASPPMEGGTIQLGPVRGNKLFNVIEVQPDGHGAAKLVLMNA